MLQFSTCFPVCSNEPLTVQAPGTQTRSFCYVSDLVSKVCWKMFVKSWLDLSASLSHNFSLWLLKVDGLMRLMEGEHTGPINLGNPGYWFIFVANLLHHSIWGWWDGSHFVAFTYSSRDVPGEFTMIELAETVKEVSEFCNQLNRVKKMGKRVDQRIILHCSLSILKWRSNRWRTLQMILVKGSRSLPKQRSCSDGSQRSNCEMAFHSWRMILGRGFEFPERTKQNHVLSANPSSSSYLEIWLLYCL